MGLSTIRRFETEIAGAPEGVHLMPRTSGDVAQILRVATEERIPVRVWGGGTRQKMGEPPGKGLVLSTAGLGGVEAYEPDDLTIVAGSGISIKELESTLGQRSQTAVLPEAPGNATLGGVLSTGRGSLRRGRLLGPRERVLELTVVTGDGRVVRSGGRVVKNVSGYDLHRAAIGSFGALGVIVSACLKLWPIPRSSATIRVSDPADLERVVRPLAVLESGEGIDLFVWGTAGDVDETVRTVPGEARDGLHWPDDPDGEYRWLLRVPPARTAEAVKRVEPWNFLALRGVGEVRLGSSDLEGYDTIRSWAESVGGALVLVDHPEDLPPIDPWGADPPALALQRRLVEQFDPARIVNPHRLPGRL